MLDELRALRTEVNELKAESEDLEDGVDDFGMGKIGRILQHPTIGPMAQNFVGALTQMIQRVGPQRKISGVPGETNAGQDNFQVDPASLQALKTLFGSVPDFSSVLLKLEQLAVRQPETMKVYVNALRNMQL